MAHVGERGYPVPGVEVLSETEMVLERIDGPTMLDDLARRPWRVLAHARVLAALHQRLHRIAAPEWLGAAGEGSAVLHLDLHPANVMLAGRGPVVIDWANARRGAGALDVALAWVVIATSDLPEVPARPIIRALRALFVRGFLAQFDRAEVRSALPSAARMRVADRNVNDRERGRVRWLARL
jgi:aminoglycoside phosphotransferase (APT) family kinase protein